MLRQDFISTLQEEATLEECSEALAAAVLRSWLSLSLVVSISHVFLLQGTIRGINSYLQIFF